MTRPLQDRPLSGLCVLELGQMVAAPYCGKLLADLGADVIKIERPRVGDGARRRGPFPGGVPHPEKSGLFLYLNTSKRGITLDLETEAGRGIFLRLVADAAALIDDWPPGELARIGLDPDALARANPRLVHTSITPFGASGPHRDFRTHHLNVYHSSPHTTFSTPAEGAPRRAPPRAGRYLAEYDAGLSAAVGTMAAVLGALATGTGERVEVSKQEALLCLERVDIGRQINPPKPPPWTGSIGGLLRAKDGWVMVTPVQNHQWEGLVRAMGSPEWTRSEACKDEAARQAHRDEIQPRIQEWADGLTRAEIYHRLQAEGTPAGPIQTVAEVRVWPQERERDFFVEIDHPEAGAQTYPSVPYRFDDVGWTGSRAPLLGEHNREILGERLGHASGELARLAASGVI
ncbi:MAG: CoA transferase [Deltaproteobacteria bacterium]|nr:CoA transferase [Deltaproteobacteria bacterium]